MWAMEKQLFPINSQNPISLDYQKSLEALIMLALCAGEISASNNS
jgi:hypothetical protein